MQSDLDEIFEAPNRDEARSASKELAAELNGKAGRAIETLELGLE